MFTPGRLGVNFLRHQVVLNRISRARSVANDLCHFESVRRKLGPAIRGKVGLFETGRVWPGSRAEVARDKQCPAGASRQQRFRRRRAHRRPGCRWVGRADRSRGRQEGSRIRTSYRRERMVFELFALAKPADACEDLVDAVAIGIRFANPNQFKLG